MVGTEFLDYLNKLQVTTYVGVEDFADKFNFLVTVLVLLLCTTIVTVKQYMMKPISCYMATDLGGKNLLDYVENYCWVQGTVPISYSGRVPETDEGWKEMEQHKLLYYQWVPFVLGLQCIMFYIPRLIWQMICYNRTGTDIQHLVLSANQAVHASEEQRTKMIQHVARTLEQLLFQRVKWKTEQHRFLARNPSGTTGPNDCATDAIDPGSLEMQKLAPRSYKAADLESSFARDSKHPPVYGSTGETPERNSHSWLGLVCTRVWHACCMHRFNRHRGTFLSLAYLFVKLLYLANSIGQLFLMQYFLGFSENDKVFGFAILHSILNGRDWQSTLIFPRVAYCYAPVKHLGTRTNTATAQCVLPVNMLNEKIYIFLWWWILFVATLNVLSLLRWCVRMISRAGAVAFVTKYLTLGENLDPKDTHLLDQFVRRFLRQDGVFILKMLSYNVGELITSEVLAQLWSTYRARLLAAHAKEDTLKPVVEATFDKVVGEVAPELQIGPSAPGQGDVDERRSVTVGFPSLPPKRTADYPPETVGSRVPSRNFPVPADSETSLRIRPTPYPPAHILARSANMNATEV